MALVLAGGRSSRARGRKACRRIDGRSWLGNQCRHLRSQGFRQVHVVVGFSAAKTARCVPPGVRRIWNRERMHNAFASLQAGLRGVRSAVLVIPIDARPPAPATIYRLRQALRGAPAAVPIWRGRGGHPVLLSPYMVAEIQRLPNSAAGRLDYLLASAAARRVSVQDRSIRGNMNRPSDWLLYLRCRKLRRPLWTG